MALPCTPFGPWAHYNKVHAPQAWLESYMRYAPLGRLCGHIALYQLSHENDFINEQPRGSA
eukprot:7150577-Heterocapsa_arctica.AAC.1